MKFSVSKQSITPAWPVNMGGYAFRTEKSKGVYEEIYSRCFLLDDGNGRTLIVALDIVGLDREFVSKVKNKIEKAFGLKSEDILIHCTHSHSGPSTFPFPTFFSKPEKEYMDYLDQKIMVSVEKCMASTREGEVFVGSGETFIGMNRRWKTETGYMLKPNEKGSVDRNLTVLTVKNRRKEIEVVLFSCACHPTVMSYENLMISADYPGAACKYIEMLFPGCTAVFIQGAGADINPAVVTADRAYRKRYFSDVEFMGRIIANDVANIVRLGMENICISLMNMLENISLPLDEFSENIFNDMLINGNETQKEYAANIFRFMESKEKPAREVDFQVGIYQLSPKFRIAALEGEICHGYGAGIRSLFGKGMTLVSGYSNGIISYIPTRKILMEGGYEAIANCSTYGLPACFEGNVEEVILKYFAKHAAGDNNRL